MKYLAILKDSLYETIDFKVFYVLVALSILLAALVGSFTFPRKPIEEVLDKNINLEREWGKKIGAIATISDVKTLQTESFGPRARYRFVMTPVTPEGLHKRLREVMQAHVLLKQLPLEMVGAQLNEDEKAARRTAGVDQGEELARAKEVGEKVVKKLGELPKDADEPKTEAEWQERLRAFFANVSGVTDVAELKLELGPTGVPNRIEAELEVNWSELIYAHQYGFVYGTWKVDMPIPLGVALFMPFQSLLIGGIAGWAGIIIALIVTAGFIPNMLQKGTVDLLIVKPLMRPVLLLYKYLGGLAFVFFNSCVLVGGTWIAFGITAGVWSYWYLASILVLTFFFAILYSMSALLGVLTRSQLVCILVTIGFWFILFLVNRGYILVNNQEIKKHVPEWLGSSVNAVHYVLPKPSDLTFLNEELLLRSNGLDEIVERRKKGDVGVFSWTNTLWTSSAFIVVMLGLACWRFSRKDY